MTPNRQHAISHGTIEVIWILPHDLCLPNIDTVAACNNYSFILDLSQPFWCTDQLINNHNSLMKFLISLLNTAVRVLISLKCHSAPACVCIECMQVCGSSPQSLGMGAEATWWITGRWWEEAQPSTVSPSTRSETSSFVISPSGPMARTILEVLF